MTVETPFGKREACLGGSSTYTALAAALFTDVNLVSVVGNDFPDEHLQMFQDRGISTAGIEVVPDGKTFRWSGKYSADMNQRDTSTCN